MTVSEACEFFKNQPRIYRKLAVLEDVALATFIWDRQRRR